MTFLSLFYDVTKYHFLLNCMFFLLLFTTTTVTKQHYFLYVEKNVFFFYLILCVNSFKVFVEYEAK